MLTTKYLGLTLSSPIIVSSSPYTSNIQNIIDAQKHGAGAVVLKSIFEEQIIDQITHTQTYEDYPEAQAYIKEYIADNNINLHIELIKEAKKKTKIPIIASINCSQKGPWTKFAASLQSAGADAIELNIFHLPTSKNETATDIENQYLEIIAEVQKTVNIPISVKIAQNFTNPINIANEIYFRQVKGIVLFNRFYTPDIDIENLSMAAANPWSNNAEIHNIIRWTGIIASQIPLLDIAASTGVRSGADAVKLMLAGARTVQICSAIHENKINIISQINTFISQWMIKHNFNNTTDFIGKLSYKNILDTNAYERTQFMKYFSSKKDY